MDKYLVLQVADTRFAIGCNNPSYTEWLAKRYQGFISQGEPYQWFNINLDSVSTDSNDSLFLSVKSSEDHHEDGELTLIGKCSEFTSFSLLMLQICLRCTILAKQPPDLLLHSAGVIQGERAYLFTGASGTGKSTVCKLLSREPTLTILHDEAVAISQTEAGFRAWSTPFRGEILAKNSCGAPLRAIFSLKHGQTNHATRLSGKRAVESLFFNVMPPLIVKNGGLGVDLTETMKLLLTLADIVPCYELCFRPEHGLWDYISSIFEKEPVTTLTKGQI